MTLPLPLDPDFRKAAVGFWLDDVEDRIQLNRVDDAEKSWQEANLIYLSLPAGCGDMSLEDQIAAMRVKLDNISQKL
jgi:hypothetical protein